LTNPKKIFDGRSTGDRTGGYAEEREVVFPLLRAVVMNGSIATLRYTALFDPSSTPKACPE
jgi:hypothetical protein